MTGVYYKSSPLVWVVDSEYTGELHARIGLAERLGYGYQLIPIPNGNTQNYQKYLQSLYLQQGNNQPPLLVISGTGEETTAEIADLRSLFNGQLYNVYLASILPDERHPRLAEYDLVASPQLSGCNIYTMPSVPHQLTRVGLADAYQQYESYFKDLPKPIIAVLVGGNTRYCNGFTEDHARQFARRVFNISKELGGCVLVSNSRRTPPSSLVSLLDELTGLTFYFFDWQKIEKHFYHAILAHANIFVVSGDSLSMCSEAAFTGKPVLVDLNSSATECYHREIIGRLIDYGAARLLTDKFEPWSYIPPDPVAKLVGIIQKHFREIYQS